MTHNTHATTLNLDQYLQAARARYDECVDKIAIELTHDNPTATLRFHHLRLDDNGEPKFRELAACLHAHLINYCFSSRTRGRSQSDIDLSLLKRKAIDLLRSNPKTGEPGDMLLYLLCECILGAPQMVAKMELKTNPKMELHGSDGIHMKWDTTSSCLDVYFGEAKLYQRLTGALTSLLDSVEKFHHGNLFEHELRVVTSHYKHADDDTKDRILQFVDRESGGSDCRIHHACLVGYDWNKYRNMQGSTVREQTEDFKTAYIQDTERISTALFDKFTAFERKYLRFEVFFVPFRTVQEFRDAFLEVI